MVRILTKKAYESIKSRQRQHWSIEAITNHLDWSDRTIRRVFKSADWAGYRRARWAESRRMTIARAERRGAFAHSADGTTSGIYHITGDKTVRPKHKGFFARLFGK